MGIYGFNTMAATDIDLSTVCDWPRQVCNLAKMDSLIFTFHTAKDETFYVKQWPKYFPPARPVTPVLTTMKRSVGASVVAPASVIGSHLKED